MEILQILETYRLIIARYLLVDVKRNRIFLSLGTKAVSAVINAGDLIKTEYDGPSNT